MTSKNIFSLLLCALLTGSAGAQSENRWQQRVNYKMTIDVDAAKNQFKGKQRLEYTNNSPQALTKVFYHLYWNAFQPNSSMDVRSRELGKQMMNNRPDWDPRVRDRISKLKPEEIGYQRITSLKMNGVPQQLIYHETILEVQLSRPIAANSKAVFEMEFEAQVPLQVRRSGRDNPTTGVRFSMSQWYPKMCEYDYEGWHPTPYIAREFYGVWGDFDVTINIDKNYKLGGTGVLTNANEIGWGYDKPGTQLKEVTSPMRTWKFSAKNVHDFVWAADPEYVHITRPVPGGPTVHVLYNLKPNDAKNDSAWQAVGDAAVHVLPFIESHFGKYPYAQYSFIQGGDGGMEYPMATLIISSSLGTVFHEWLHSWYQMMLGTNESEYGWMDEGFTEYATELVSAYHRNTVIRPRSSGNIGAKRIYDSLDAILPQFQADNYNSYFALARSGREEPLTTHADHFNSNFAYSIASYSKGAVFLSQLGYIIGADTRDKLLLEYYKRWRFKHPNANDFVVLAQEVSGLQLDWYKEYWVNTTKQIDYAIDSAWEVNGTARLRLKRIGQLPMPIDVQVRSKNGDISNYTIPLNLMFGAKANEGGITFEKQEAWRWTHPEYILTVNMPLKNILYAEIDPSLRLADVKPDNNVFEPK